jgi:predicted DNA-binding transcriptional regulator YafY
MPINKNAIIRYQILDELLSNRYHNYSLDDLTEEVNKRFAEIRPKKDNIGRRTIEKDIHFLEKEDPFWADIEKYSVDCYDYNKQRAYSKRCLRYANPSFSIFKRELTSDEKYLLRELFSLLGQFDGLPKLGGLERLRLSLGSHSNRKPILSLTKNPLENTNYLGVLFTAISQKQVIELRYRKFDEPDKDIVYRLYPYLLREYEGRWYLYAGRVENDKIKCFPLDRIVKITIVPSIKYKGFEGDINEIFEDIIGVSYYYEDTTVHNILFWVSDYSKDYVLTKPLHESQRTLNKKTCDELHEKFPSLQGGQFFRIDCRKNYELIRELCSYGQHLLVLEPSCIQDEIFERIKAINEDYSKLRIKRS